MKAGLAVAGIALAALLAFGASSSTKKRKPLLPRGGPPPAATFPGSPPIVNAVVARARDRAGKTGVPYWHDKINLTNDPEANALKAFELEHRDAIRAEFGKRRLALFQTRKDAMPTADRYSTRAFPLWEAQPNTGKPLQYGQWLWVDEYGRNFGVEGGPGFGFGTVVQIAQVVLPYVPGVGTAGSMALAAAIAVGQGKSAQDVALAAARSALPPYAQIAFDLGVAVASGQSVDKAAEETLLNQLDQKYPGAKNAYAIGKSKAKELGA